MVVISKVRKLIIIVVVGLCDLALLCYVIIVIVNVTGACKMNGVFVVVCC